MDLTIRDWMVIIGVLLITAVLLDAWRRVRRERNPRVKLKLADTEEFGTIFLTHPTGEEEPCVLSKRIEIPKDGKTALELVVGLDQSIGDWELIVKADGKELKRTIIGEDTTTDGAMELSIDLSAYAGQTVFIELLNQANGWNMEAGEYETAIWLKIELVTE